MAEPWVELNGRQFRHWVWSLADAEWSFVPTEDMEDEISPMIDRLYQEPPPNGTSDDYAQYLMLPAVRAEWASHFRRYPSQAPESYLYRTPTSAQMPATIEIALEDFQEWRLAHTLTRWELQKRARAARRKHEAIVLLDVTQFERWVEGRLTPWRRPDALGVTPLYGPSWSRVVLPDQIQER